MRRQATESAQELLDDLEVAHPSLSELSDASLPALDPDWALPALVSAWSLTMGEGEVLWRPAIKAAVVALKNSSSAGTSRSRKVLEAFVQGHGRMVSNDLEPYNANWRHPDAEDEVDGALDAVGRSLQTAVDASGLIGMGLTKAMAHLRPFAHGNGDPSSFSSTAPHLADVARDSRTVWTGLYLRFVTLHSILAYNTELGEAENPTKAIAVLPRDFYTDAHVLIDGEDAYAGLTDEDVTTLLAGENSWSYEDEAMLGAFPLLPIGEDRWVTSIALLLDSIAPFLLLAINGTGQWEAVMGSPFERAVVSFLNEQGFIAGEVSKSGYWDVHLPDSRDRLRTESTQTLIKRARKELQRRDPSQPAGGGLSGQIDVLATDGRDWFVFECKSILAAANPRNISERVSVLDSGEWRSKLRAKVAWVESRLGLSVALSAVVIEGVEYVATSEINADPPVVTFDLLRQTIAAGVEH